jgi:cytochrome c oxidase assembly protein subunit 15
MLKLPGSRWITRHSASRPSGAALRALSGILRLALAGVLLGFCVVVLGAYVRLSAAGLGCPDWPGCYGHATVVGAEQSAGAQAAYPNRPLEAGKAWREMTHRYAAGTLVLIIIAIAGFAIATRESRIVPPGYALALFGIVVLQAILGMLTVTLLLKPLIVTLHLLFGLTTLGLIWWLYLSLPRKRWGALPAAGASSGSARAVTIFALCVLGIQIALGGWTSSNYAAVACPDFPKCQNAWWPHADYGNAFVLWRGLAINFEGGVLDNPARVAIHLTHRMGALVTALVLVTAAVLTLLRTRQPAKRMAAIAVLTALALQLSIGIAMVLKGFPLWLATAHNAGAALLLLATLALAWAWSRSAQSGPF